MARKYCCVRQSSSAISATARPWRSRALRRILPTEFITTYLLSAVEFRDFNPGCTIIHHSVNLSPQKSKVLVGVVVANWNRKELLRACLNSLARQSHRSFEVVVVDNGSTDGSPALVEETAKSYPVRLRLIANTANLGFCAANNQGIFSTDSDLVALLNNDAEAEPGWLEALERAIRLGEDVGMAASKVLV